MAEPVTGDTSLDEARAMLSGPGPTQLRAAVYSP